MKLKHILVLMTVISSFTAAQNKRPVTIEELYKVKNVGAPVVSPSGDKVLFTVSESFLKEGKTASDIYMMNIDGSGIENLTGGGKNEYSQFWSNDGSAFYYLEAGQLYKFDLEDKEAEKLTDFYTGIESPKLSSDGKYILFLSEVYPECGADSKCNQRISESASEGPVQAYIADELMFRHWTSYTDLKETMLFIFDIEEEKITPVTSSNWFHFGFMLGGDVKFDISPDGTEIVFMKNAQKNIAASTNADLFVIDVEGKNQPENITVNNKAWDGYPVYSPDGKYIAYKMQKQADFEADRYRIAIYDRAAKSSRVLTEDFDYTVNDIQWSDDSKTIYFSADFEGYSPVYKISVDGGRVEQISSKRSIFGYEIIGGDKLIYNARSVDKPGEIYTAAFGSEDETQLTFYNKELLEEVDFRPAEQLWIEGAAGKNVHVFLVKPHNFDPGKKYPLILNVHGGPQSQWMDSFRGDWQVYPGAGYIVAFPNPHGSTGYGSAYTEAISGDWGGKVYEDLMKVTDELEKLPYVDKDRIGAMGWSYGGYMMNWFQAKTKRYKCLASMMGIFDLESMWGETEELWFVNWDLKGQPWNSDIYEKYSPSNYVESFSTPTLIITGKLDYRVPYTQSVQYFNTLQTLGIDSRLIIFENDGHWPSGIKSMPLYYNAHLEWFAKYLGGAAAPYDSRELIKNTVFSD